MKKLLLITKFSSDIREKIKKDTILWEQQVAAASYERKLYPSIETVGS